MAQKTPILLSFYACTNGATTLLFGQLTCTNIHDLTFNAYSKPKTFKTLFRLYQTKPLANTKLSLVFDSWQLELTTDRKGGFYQKVSHQGKNGTLKKIILTDGREARIIDELYDRSVHHFKSQTIVISDLDDTLMHSYISRTLRKIRTLMFTTMEKRKTVATMQKLLRQYVSEGAELMYLSNSEQNLYPIIYRFLQYNKFPKGPIFLKQLRSLWNVVLNVKFPLKNAHKITTLEELIKLFPERKFVLMGDNTQQDLTIYTEVAYKFPQNIYAIYIRKVVDKASDLRLIEAFKKEMLQRPVKLFYADVFPDLQPS